MKRIYHHVDMWEEVPAGMWDIIPKEKEEKSLKDTIEFASNAKLFGEYMTKVTKQWKYSCEHNLSYKGLNRQAWIGQAACCLAIKTPEYIVRQAWHYLTDDQRLLANNEADMAIKKWEEAQCQKGCWEQMCIQWQQSE